MKLKVNEVSSELEETPNIIRNWLREFKAYIPVEKADNGYNLFTPAAVDVLRTIQKLHREQGYSTRQIEHYLATGGEIAVAVATDPVRPGEVDELKSMIQQLMQQQQRQEGFNQELLNRMDQRDQMLTEYMAERRQLMQREKEQENRRWWRPWKK